MREENARSREKFELSLDGRQIASIVVGALVILGVIFVLGLNVGRQMAARQAEAVRGAGDLDALDRVPVAAPAAPARNDLTFYDQLPKAKPPAPPPVEARPASAPAPAPAAAAPAPSAAPAPAPAAPSVAVAPAPAGSPKPAAAPASAPKPAPAAATPKPAAAGAFAVQLAATQSRTEAERIAAKYRGLSPRIEAADVPGKGRFYRVRAGSFATRAEAERYLRDAERESGAKGFVTASR